MKEVKNKTFDLDLNSDAFNAFKADFNAMLKAILSGMEKNQADNGEITVTMKIGLEEKEVIDRGYARTTMVPSFSHKVVSKMQFKAEKKGALSGNFELKYDESTGKYYLEEIFDGQASLFDDSSKDIPLLDVSGEFDYDDDEDDEDGDDEYDVDDEDDDDDGENDEEGEYSVEDFEADFEDSEEVPF